MSIEAANRLRDHLAQLAIEYHKATDGTGEGEYGCPGLTCPGVQRLTAFAEKCAAAALLDRWVEPFEPRTSKGETP